MKGSREFIAAAIAALLAVMAMGSTALAAEPSVETDYSNATVTFNPGILELKTVPDFTFGAHNIPESGNGEYKAQTISGPLRVSDARGTGKGWQVTVALDSFKQDENKTLNGALITLSGGKAEAPDGNLVETAPSVSTPVEILSNNVEKKLVTATANTGKGTWDTEWQETGASVKLTVPASSHTVGAHSAVMTWNLIDAP